MLMLPVYADVVKSVLLASWPGLTFNFRLGEGSDLHNDDEGSVSHTGVAGKVSAFWFFSQTHLSLLLQVFRPHPSLLALLLLLHFLRYAQTELTAGYSLHLLSLLPPYI